MAQIPAEIKKIIDKYLTALEAHNIPIRQAIIFGSYAKGNYEDWSDIDIALVSAGDSAPHKNRLIVLGKFIYFKILHLFIKYQKKPATNPTGRDCSIGAVGFVPNYQFWERKAV